MAHSLKIQISVHENMPVPGIDSMRLERGFVLVAVAAGGRLVLVVPRNLHAGC